MGNKTVSPCSYSAQRKLEIFISSLFPPWSCNQFLSFIIKNYVVSAQWQSCALVFWQAYFSSLLNTSETWGHFMFHWLTCCVKHSVMKHTEYAWIQPKCIHPAFSFLKLCSAKWVMIFSLDLNVNLWEKIILIKLWHD